MAKRGMDTARHSTSPDTLQEPRKWLSAREALTGIAPATHAVTHVTHATHKRTREAERQARYRERHGDDYRQRHADYMRQWRAQRRAAAGSARPSDVQEALQ